MKLYSYQIEQVIKDFDFKSVQKVMKALDWKWIGSDDIPTVKEMKDTVRGLIQKLQDDSLAMIGTGGFFVVRNGDDFVLSFEIESVDSGDFDKSNFKILNSDTELH